MSTGPDVSGFRKTIAWSSAGKVYERLIRHGFVAL